VSANPEELEDLKPNPREIAVTQEAAEEWIGRLVRYEKTAEFYDRQAEHARSRAEEVREWLRAYAITLRKTEGLKTVELPSATLQTRPGRERTVIENSTAFKGWALERGFKKLVVDETAAKAAVRWTEDGSGVDPNTGEEVPGIIRILPDPDSFTLSIQPRFVKEGDTR